jgi:hypothetical protein
MNRSLAMKQGNQSAIGTVVPTCRRLIMIGSLAFAVAMPALAQSPELQQKLAAVKQVIAINKQSLQTYQWIETTQMTLDGDPKPQTQNLCQYGPGGQVQKTPIGAPPPPPSGGRLKQRIIEKKKAEMQDYMTEVKGLLSMYVPPDPQKMQQAYGSGNAFLNPQGGLTNLVFKNYAQPGDQLTLTFDPSGPKVISLSVNTYMGQEKDAVTLQVQMAGLPDGTNYVQQTVLNATAKKLVVTTTSSNYQKMGQ